MSLNAVCIHESKPLIIMKMEMKIKKRSHRYDINRPRSRHGQKYTKFVYTKFTKCVWL